MIAINYTTMRTNLSHYLDEATENNETVIVTRKGKVDKNVVIISIDQYNSIMKAAKNAEYLMKIDRSIDQLQRGEGKDHDLIEVDDE
ncbi:MAG: type II toxin-antitoxin system Phd/YefM family antitoxin [Eubacterium sp.]